MGDARFIHLDTLEVLGFFIKVETGAGKAHTLDSECGTEAESGKEVRMGDAGGSAGLGVACCASVLWMLANLRCSRSTWCSSDSSERRRASSAARTAATSNTASRSSSYAA